MTLEDAFQGMLTSNVKGLQLLTCKLSTSAGETKEITEAGDLAGLKEKLANLRKIVGTLDQLLGNMEARAAQLTTDERGGILDLSIPADRRK